MKTKIRTQMFESNSSSSHSICWSAATESTTFDSIRPNKDGAIIIEDDWQFGWGPDSENSPMGKLAYALIDTYDEEAKERIYNVVKEHTGAIKIVNKMNPNNYDSYIDHQSIGTFSDNEYSDADIKNFIFNNKVQVIIDHDNH